MRGACLYWRFAVNGIQYALRSFGVTFNLSDMTKLSFLPFVQCGQRLVFRAQLCYAIFHQLKKRNPRHGGGQEDSRGNGPAESRSTDHEELVQRIGPEW